MFVYVCDYVSNYTDLANSVHAIVIETDWYPMLHHKFFLNNTYGNTD